MKNYDDKLQKMFLDRILFDFSNQQKQIKFRNKSVDKFKKYGFIVKAHSNIIGEHTWFFETKNQANQAFHIFKNSNLDGWFYSINELPETIEYYEKTFSDKFPRIDYF